MDQKKLGRGSEGQKYMKAVIYHLILQYQGNFLSRFVTASKH